MVVICVRFKSDGYASLTRCVVHDDVAANLSQHADFFELRHSTYRMCYQSNLSKNSAGVRSRARRPKKTGRKTKAISTAYLARGCVKLSLLLLWSIH